MFVPLVVSDEFSYSHLLGLCLGDGCVDARGRLRLADGTAHPDILDDAEVSLRLVAFGRVRRPDPFLLRGPDRRHERRIVLELWQQVIVDREPEAFLRGLIRADGCRVINRFTTKLRSGRVAEYAYPRYFFSNASADIRGLFCASCERIGVDWTQSNRRTISVSHRRSVALLDTFVGPKI